MPDRTRPSARSSTSRATSSKVAVSTGASPIDEPLGDVGQMRRGVARGAQPAGAQRRVGHGRHRPLAVGAGDVQRGEAALGMAQRLAQQRDVLETELDPEGFEREETVEQQSGGRTWPGPRTDAVVGGTAAAPDSAPMKRRARATVAFRSRRSTTRSSMPCSARNSLRWNPSGSFWRMVCSMTRGPGEADERLGLGDVHVAQHREAGGHAAGGRVGQDGDVGQPRAVEPRQRRRHLGHLHQRQRAFHHPRAAGARDDDDRLPALERQSPRRASASRRPPRPCCRR